MIRLRDGLRSGVLPAILYSDGTQLSKKVEQWLEEAGANFTVLDARLDSFNEPVLIVDGAFLRTADIKAILGIMESTLDGGKRE
jgi:hypothetical protein